MAGVGKRGRGCSPGNKHRQGHPNKNVWVYDCFKNFQNSTWPQMTCFMGGAQNDQKMTTSHLPFKNDNTGSNETLQRLQPTMISLRHLPGKQNKKIGRCYKDFLLKSTVSSPVFWLHSQQKFEPACARGDADFYTNVSWQKNFGEKEVSRIQP